MIGSLSRRPAGRRSRRPYAAWAASAVLLTLTAGCTTSGAGTGAKGYIAGNGVVTQIEAAERREAPDLEGQSLSGKPIALSDHAGNIVVVNVWASWCGPCRSEADDLVEATEQLAPDGVRFLGINARDSDAAARAFVRNHGLTYESIVDPKGKLMLRFYGLLTLSSIPTTIVIDADGRIAALVSGEVTVRTLVDLVGDVAAES